jgi:arylsulfatase A-like enzyme
VIIIFTDDHGYTDLGIHGVDPNVRTPTMDALAAGGALMQNGYSTAPQCVPSRAGILTGRIQNTFGTRDNGVIYEGGAIPLDVPTLAERLQTIGGYKTGMVGKWHINPTATADPDGYPGELPDYQPETRGFQEYFRNPLSPYAANFDLSGNTLDPAQSIDDPRNRVIVQGEAAEAFIERNRDQPFFLYFAPYGPHLPRMEKTDSYYLDFPVLNYPNYSAEMDDIRRLGLGLVWAIDDAVKGVMQKLRDLGIEENTLILLAGDNGAQPKFWDGVPGTHTLDFWTGNENIPLRGEKGSLWEGGIKVPMFAYWKGRIPGGQVIDEPVWTLDFAATILKLAGGTIPPEFDGVDLLPRLTGQTNRIDRTDALFWDWGQEIAMRRNDWKFRRIGDRKYLFNLAEDPYELFDLKYEEPERFAAMEAEMMGWYNALPPEGQSRMAETGDDLYVTGAPAGTPVDHRFSIPYSDPLPAAYPAVLTTLGTDPMLDSDGDGIPDSKEMADERDPYSASDLGFEFNTDGDYERWSPMADYLVSHSVTNGALIGTAVNGQGKIEFYDFSFSADSIENMVIRLKSPTATGLTFRWGHTQSNVFSAVRTLTAVYQSNGWISVVVPLKGHSEWDGKTITRMRLNPVNQEADFEVDWIRGSAGDLDGDFLPDFYEWQNGLDAGDPADGNEDQDGDGLTRGQEYIAGTDDDNRQSVLRIQPEGGLGFRWNGKAGRNYSVWRTSQLIQPEWIQVTNFNLLDADQTLEFSESISQDPSFYKIRVQLP